MEAGITDHIWAWEEVLTITIERIKPLGMGLGKVGDISFSQEFCACPCLGQQLVNLLADHLDIKVGIKCLQWALDHIRWHRRRRAEFLVLNLIRMRDEEECFAIWQINRSNPWRRSADTPEGSKDDTCHMPASAQEAGRSSSPARTRSATEPSTRAWPRGGTSAHGASST